MGILRWFVGLVVLLLAALGLLYYTAGKAAGPKIDISTKAIVGQQAPLTVVASSPETDALTIRIEQSGQTIPVFTLSPGSAVDRNEGGVTVTRTIGKKDFPQLQPGPAKVVVTAARPVFYGVRHVASTASTNIQLRFDPPRIAVVSTKHYINVGGSEMIVYRVTPHDAQSGVKVGDFTYPGFAADGAGIHGEPSLKVAFFALLYNQ